MKQVQACQENICEAHIPHRATHPSKHSSPLLLDSLLPHIRAPRALIGVNCPDQTHLGAPPPQFSSRLGPQSWPELHRRSTHLCLALVPPGLSLSFLVLKEQAALPAPCHLSYKSSFSFKLHEIRTNRNLGRAVQKIRVSMHIFSTPPPALAG